MYNIKQMRKDYYFMLTEYEWYERDAISDAEALDDLLLGNISMEDAILKQIEYASNEIHEDDKKLRKIRDRYGI